MPFERPVMSWISNSWSNFSDGKLWFYMSAISSERAIQMKQTALAYMLQLSIKDAFIGRHTQCIIYHWCN